MRSSSKYLSGFALCCLLFHAATSVATASDWHKVDITVATDKIQGESAPVRFTLDAPKSLLDSPYVAVCKPDQSFLVGQLTKPSIGSDAEASESLREVTFIAPKTDKPMKIIAIAPVASTKTKPGFSWKPGPDQSRELLLKDKPVFRYMHPTYDNSSEEAREKSYKPFHHVYNPAGETILTKGAGGKYTHHRGLFYGFNKVTHGDGKKTDIWHCKGKARQAHAGFASEETGPVLGRHLLEIDWRGSDGKVFAKELREMTAYQMPGGTMLDFVSKLESTDGKIHLDGDPQHAGFHFRASQELWDKTKADTYYVRTDGKGKKGETRNWNHKNRKDPMNKECESRPWNAMSFVVGDQRYTAVYMDHPDNPKPARYSERDYGRFGSYFVHDVTPDEPLVVRYRIWLQDGELTVEEAKSLSENFVNPPKVEVKAG